MTNPNYDVKDHVYDEIKHKDGYKDLGKLNCISAEILQLFYFVQFCLMHALRYDTK